MLRPLCIASLLTLAACGGGNDTATVSAAEMVGSPVACTGGQPAPNACDPSHKTVICHIPPGNPGNAHTICVGNPAVDPHIRQHGDYLGCCAPAASTDGGTTTPPSGDDAGTPTGGTDGGSTGPIT
jgi:hypothetical protein